MSNTIQLRAANDEDKVLILSLLNNVFNEQERTTTKRDHKYWAWKFKESPFGPSILSVGVDGEKIVAVDNLWTWEFRFRGKVLRAIQPCDTVVHVDYRGKGLFKRLRKFGLSEAERQGYSLAFNFPNENSLPGNLTIGAHYLGKISWWVKVLKPFNLVKNKIFNCDNKDFDLPNKYILNIDIIDQTASHIERIDESITIHRIPGFHQWRYAEHPNRTYGMIDIRQGLKQTIVIFTVNSKGSSREMVVVDLIGDTGQKSMVINSIVEAGREMDADFIAVINNYQFEIEHLWMHFFLKKKLKNMVVTPISPELSVDISSIENWSMVAGMHDSI